MARKRNPKKGFVYLLESKEDINNLRIYKYGCTEKSIKRRADSHSRYLKKRFKVIAQFSSDDIYMSENKIKWNLKDHEGEQVSSSEFFLFDHRNVKELIENFIKVGG